MDDGRFALKANGVCNLARPKKSHARIWQLAKDKESGRLRFRVKPETPEERAA